MRFFQVIFFCFPCLHFCLVTACVAAAPPCAQGISIYCHLMVPARNSRIIIASNRIFALAPIGASHEAYVPSISLLLSEKSGSCIGLTQDGSLFVLNVPSSSCSSNRTDTLTTIPSSLCDDSNAIGNRCLPVTALEGHHSMHASAACLFSNFSAHQGSQTQPPRIESPAIVIYFSPPPISSNTPIDLRIHGRREAKGQQHGCLQAHSVADGQLLRIFEGCSDAINCIAVSSGDNSIGRYLLAGSDQEEGGATLFMWPLVPSGESAVVGDMRTPLLVSVQADKVYPACGAITCIVGRATDVIIAFAGGKIAIFSLISRNFKCDCIFFA